MKILWAKAGGLVPPDTGGKIRSHNILLHLARDHAVTLFSFYAAHDNDVHADLAGIFDHVVTIPLNLPSARGVGGMWDYVTHSLSSEPYNLTRFCRPGIRNRLRTLLHETTYDVLL